MVTHTTVLHLTPHLGGGVGKALSSLYIQALRSGSEFEHSFVLLEKPEKSVFLESILQAGGRVHVEPEAEKLRSLIANSDIVHLDWWNHPSIFLALCDVELPPMRLLVWCHVSGLSVPFLPSKLIGAAQRFVFTSSCSLDAWNVCTLDASSKEKLAVVSSGCGAEHFPEPKTSAGGPLKAGYIGSLNFAKMHPHYVDYVATVDLPQFSVAVFGDSINQQALEARCDAIGRPGLLSFSGFQNDIAKALHELDVLIYLLNPEHYGTAENVLIESMAMGVIPIVLDNPAEIRIIEDGVTGYILKSSNELASLIRMLAENPDIRLKISRQSALRARTHYTSQRMEMGLASEYQLVRRNGKERIDFSMLLGREAADWFLSCQGRESPFNEDGTIRNGGPELSPMIFENTKGSVFHFHRYFPNDEKIESWVHALEQQQ